MDVLLKIVGSIIIAWVALLTVCILCSLKISGQISQWEMSNLMECDFCEGCLYSGCQKDKYPCSACVNGSRFTTEREP